jgi:hypothetical protein
MSKSKSHGLMLCPFRKREMSVPAGNVRDGNAQLSSEAPVNSIAFRIQARCGPRGNAEPGEGRRK